MNSNDTLIFIYIYLIYGSTRRADCIYCCCSIIAVDAPRENKQANLSRSMVRFVGGKAP